MVIAHLYYTCLHSVTANANRLAVWPAAQWCSPSAGSGWFGASAVRSRK